MSKLTNPFICIVHFYSIYLTTFDDNIGNQHVPIIENCLPAILSHNTFQVTSPKGVYYFIITDGVHSSIEDRQCSKNINQLYLLYSRFVITF